MSMMEIINLTSEDIEKMMEDHERLNPKREIRPDIKAALDAWGTKAFPVGDFLRSVLENNLMEAMGRADSYNRASLWEICGYVYNQLPSECHGSPEKFRAWQERFAP